MHTNHYDILIVGAGVAGSSLAHVLFAVTSKIRRSPICVALLEHSLSEPDRIVDELLLPAGVTVLQKLGFEGALEETDAIPEEGYCIVQSGHFIHLPFPDGRQSCSFHCGKCIIRLREYAKRAQSMDVIEATVNELIGCQHTKRVLGVRATHSSAGNGKKTAFFADLVVIADGCFSNFRNTVMGKAVRRPSTRSNFIGIIPQECVITKASALYCGPS